MALEITKNLTATLIQRERIKTLCAVHLCNYAECRLHDIKNVLLQLDKFQLNYYVVLSVDVREKVDKSENFFWNFYYYAYERDVLFKTVFVIVIKCY